MKWEVSNAGNKKVKITGTYRGISVSLIGTCIDCMRTKIRAKLAKIVAEEEKRHAKNDR